MHPTTLLTLFIVFLVVQANILHKFALFSPPHRALISRESTSLELHVRAPSEKRCPNRKSKSLKASSSAAAPAATPNGNNKPSTPPSQPKSSPVHVNNNNNNGLIQVNGNCAPNRATRQVTSVSGPNGHIDWMNCGFEGAGWNPPHVRVQDLITVPLGVALQDPNSPFKACAAYIGLFEKYGSIYGIPAIMLASFAMQESSCQPWVVGGGGEQGLMQITRDKCGGAPGGNCQDPDFNIGQGAKYFSQTLASEGGNVLLATGRYNGWKLGLTKSAAFAAAYSSCCLCQNNGDYLMQFFNGWILNSNPRSHRLGRYFNLDVCRR